MGINPLNAELNPICHLLALVGTLHILHVSRVKVKQDSIHLVEDTKKLEAVVYTVMKLPVL
jgi:hypothetical protein